jgi:hypothetical protein
MPINLGLGFQFNWVHIKLGFLPSSLVGTLNMRKYKKTLNRHRAGFEPQRASSFMKRVKASQTLGEAVRA